MYKKRKSAVKFIEKTDKCKLFKRKKQNKTKDTLLKINNKPVKIIFKSLVKLISILNQESSFKIQIFSLESIELFQKVLKIYNLKYNLQFSSTFKNNKDLFLILKDSDLPEFLPDSRIILYSNFRSKDFVPYKFFLTNEEKKIILNNDLLFEINKRNTLSYILNEKIDIHKYTADSMNYTQCMIIFCMVNKTNLKDIFKEVISADNNLGNKFNLKCELNNLLKNGICKKIGEFYKLNISKNTIQYICNNINFKNVFQ